MVVQLGEEPKAGRMALSKLFDWTVLESLAAAGEQGVIPQESIQGPPCIGVGFSDWKRRMPSTRSELVQKAVDDGLLDIVQLPARLNVGGILRERQSFYGDLLVTIGGGPGTAHLAELYRQMRRPVIPLDLPLSPGRRRVSEILNEEAMANPNIYFDFEPPSHGATALSRLTLDGMPDLDAVSQQFVDFVRNLAAPYAFFAHLLSEKVPGYRAVTSFYDEVVTGVMTDWGFARFDPGRDASGEPFLNVEVFKMIQSSSIAVVDLTALRSNCLLELGYALGLRKKVIITARHGTKLPFDAGALPCHFWKLYGDNTTRRMDFTEFVVRNLNRRQID